MAHLEVGVPWEPGRRLGFAVNRFMAHVDDWALILDWDVALLNPGWYDMCLGTIARVGHSAGFITCVTNRIGCPLQRAQGCPAGDDLDQHRAFSLEVGRRFRGELHDVTDQDRWKLSGMFLLTHRAAWSAVGPLPPDKFLGLDNWYHDRLKERGFRLLVMRDLYVYHAYRRLWRAPDAPES